MKRLEEWHNNSGLGGLKNGENNYECTPECGLLIEHGTEEAAHAVAQSCVEVIENELLQRQRAPLLYVKTSDPSTKA